MDRKQSGIPGGRTKRGMILLERGHSVEAREEHGNTLDIQRGGGG